MFNNDDNTKIERSDKSIGTATKNNKNKSGFHILQQIIIKVVILRL